MKSLEKESNIIEYPIVEVDKFVNQLMTIHSHINEKGKMILNRAEAALLVVELHKFILDKR